MPSKSAKQRKFMRAACKGSSFRKKVGISKRDACDFYEADKKKSKRGRKK